MNSQNLYEMFSTDPVEFNLKALKAKLAIALVKLIRDNKWTQTVAAEKLQIMQPRMSNLFRGKLEKFSIDARYHGTDDDAETLFGPEIADDHFTVTGKFVF